MHGKTTYLAFLPNTFATASIREAGNWWSMKEPRPWRNLLLVKFVAGKRRGFSRGVDCAIGCIYWTISFHVTGLSWLDVQLYTVRSLILKRGEKIMILRGYGIMLITCTENGNHVNTRKPYPHQAAILIIWTSSSALTLWTLTSSMYGWPILTPCNWFHLVLGYIRTRFVEMST